VFSIAYFHRCGSAKVNYITHFLDLLHFGASFFIAMTMPI
jgi:hypothetical protein